MPTELAPAAVNCRLAAIFLLSVLLHGGLLLWQHQQPKPAPQWLPLTVNLQPGVAPSAVASTPAVPAERVLSAKSAHATAAKPARLRPLVPARQRPSARTDKVARDDVHGASPAALATAVGSALAASSATGVSPVAAAAQPLPAQTGAASSGASPNVSPNPDLLAAYRRQLGELFSRHQTYPRLAALRGWEGEVRVRLRVARKGSLLAVQLDLSSGFDVLDRHALAMLGELPALPALPEGLASEELQLVVPILYKLNRTS